MKVEEIIINKKIKIIRDESDKIYELLYNFSTIDEVINYLIYENDKFN